MRALTGTQRRLVQIGAAYLGIVVAALALQLAFRLPAGGTLFVAGAIAVLLSATYVRFGSESKLRVERPEGTLLPRVRRDHSALEEREREIRVGLSLLAFGLALWAAIFALDFL